MTYFKKSLTIALLAGIALPGLATTLQCQTVDKHSAQQCTSSDSKLYALTRVPYALCSKALCTIDKNNPKQANCQCELYKGKGWKGLSISPNAYAESKPTFGKHHHLTSVQSNYSMANLAKNPNAGTINCQFSKPMPWADCFGAQCKVTGRHKAVCACPVMNDQSFSITGPGTQKKCVTKANQVWSAIQNNTAQSNSEFVSAAYQKFYPKSPAAKAAQ